MTSSGPRRVRAIPPMDARAGVDGRDAPASTGAGRRWLANLGRYATGWKAWGAAVFVSVWWWAAASASVATTRCVPSQSCGATEALLWVGLATMTVVPGMIWWRMHRQRYSRDSQEPR